MMAMMAVCRHALGMLVVIAANSITRVSHRMIHMGAWLMDREDVNADCPTCLERL